MGKYLGTLGYLTLVKQLVLEEEKLWIQTSFTPLKN